MQVLAMPAFSNGKFNPYTSLLYEQMAGLGVEVMEFSRIGLLRGRPDVWHMHWPEGTLIESSRIRTVARVVLLFACLGVAKIKGTKRVWTIHNLHTHEQPHPWIERWFWRLFPRWVDGCISLSEAGKKLALERFKALRNKPAFVVSHGHYRGVYADTISRSEARRRLGLAPDGPVVVYFGLIRPYKNVPLLIRTFRQLDDPKAKLCIAGKPDTPRLAREIEAAVGDDPRVKVVFEFIPDDEVQLYLRTADLMVLPFTEILNSGSALLALSFDCPVLIPNKGSMQELAQRVGKEWVQTYVGDLTIQILDQALRFALDIRRAARAPLEQFDWALVAAQTLEAYQKTCAGQSPPPRL